MVLALAFALAVFVAGCGGDDNGGTTGAAAGTGTGGGGEGSIWVLLPDSASSSRWETDDRKYFEDAFTAAGVEHTIVNAEGDAAQQQSQAEQAIADGASVILLVSIDTGSGAAIIDQAKEAGVKVVEYDRFNTGGSGGDAYVSFDNVQVGATMAEEMEPVIDELGLDKPKVVMLNGGEEDNNSFLFRDGYAETVEARVARRRLGAGRRPARPRLGQRAGPDDHGADPGRRGQQGRRGVRARTTASATRRSTRSRRPGSRALRSAARTRRPQGSRTSCSASRR